MSEQKKEYLRPKVDSKGNVYSYEYDIFGQIVDTVLPYVGDRFKEFLTPAPTTNQATLKLDGSIGPKPKYKPRPSAKTKNPPPTAQPPKSSSGNVTSIGGKNYDLSDPTQKAAYNKVIAANVASRPDQRFADLRGGGGLKPVKEKTPPTPQERTNTSGPVRNEERKSPEGLPQTGTRTGPSPMTMKDLQQYLGKDVQLKNPFLSNALPGTNDDGFALPNSPVIETINGKKIKSGPISINEYNTRFSNDNKPVETQTTEGSANLVQSGGIKVNDPEDPSTWTEKYARRRAFLDADSSMAGLKAAQAQKGIVYASGKHYINTGETDDKGNPLLEAIKGKDAKQDVNEYMRGAQGAEDLKAKYINIIQSIDGKSVEDGGMTINEYNKMYPNDNEDISLTDMPEHSQKDHTGRFNKFR